MQLAAGGGELGVERVAGKSAVVSAFARSPLRLLTPKNHGHAAWIYATTFGGGMVDGDEVALRVRVGAGASALLTTQAQTKIYGPRATRVGCTQVVEADVGEDALLVVAPDPVACFADARYEQTTRVRLAAASSSIVVVDALSCGRAAMGERWAFARYRSAVELARGGASIVHDALELDRAHGDVAARLRGFEAIATIVAAGPSTHAMRAAWPALAADGVRVASFERTGADAGVLRVAAPTVERLGFVVRAALGNVPEILGDDPFARKW